ncbi:pentapeptide repeat-containing protein [Actinoplanes sp. CA-030573]|uniref:pentapeptide repeat-containing protein n=1 Tax=Actinoplanes sp. CA-030573 TaxID=3239898 RepID=UPI003D8B9BE0
MNRRPRSGPPREPRTPAELQAAGELQLELEHEQTVETTAYDDADLAGAEAEAIVFDRCGFRRTGLAGAHLPGVRFVDCRVEVSDLSNLRAEKARLERVTLTGCRATGLAAYDGLFSDVAFADCKADLTNWRFARFDVVTFRDCNLAGADFTEADLRGASFTGCDLTGAQFHRATMAGARFRRCELSGIGGITSWEGAVVHPEDLLELSYVFARALGIVVDAGDR